MISCICFPQMVSFLAAALGTLLKTRVPIKWEVIKVVLCWTAINWQWHFEHTASTLLLVYLLYFVFSNPALLVKKNNTSPVYKTSQHSAVCSQRPCYQLYHVFGSFSNNYFLFPEVWDAESTFYRESFIPISEWQIGQHFAMKSPHTNQTDLIP